MARAIEELRLAKHSAGGIYSSMAWPKRGTRSIVVDGEHFVWHYDAHCPFCSEDVMTAGKEGCAHVLFIDPFPVEMGIQPRAVAAAIRWARANGWSAEHGPTGAITLVLGGTAFKWLPAGARHANCKRVVPDNA